MLQSDFRLVADYFLEMSTNKDYDPCRDAMKHIDVVLKLMSIQTKYDRATE